MKIKTAIISLLFIPFLVFAQNGALPNAGLTPESPFYFLDKLGEALQRFFTFNPESRARLEITFAKERIAEIKVILEEKGVSAKGLTIAEGGLSDNLTRATAFLANQKQKGKDVSSLAKNLSDDFDPAREELKSTFESEANALDVKIDELKAKLKEARLAGDTTQVETLIKEIADLKSQKELLEQHEDRENGDIEEENEHFDEALGLQKEAAEKIKDVEEEKADILKEAKDDNLTIPDGAFKEFDALLSQAKAAFDAGNYEDAKRLAKEAKKNLKETEKHLESLKDAKDEEKDLIDEKEIRQHELENKLKDTDRKETEQIQEESEQKSEELESAKPSPTAQESQNPVYTLVAYRGEVFGAKVPRGWNISANQSGIDIIDPADADTGVSGVVVVGWFGTQTPDGFIDFLLQSIGATNVAVENVSDEATINDPATGLPWTMKTKTFSFQKNGKQLKAKASAGVLNGFGQYIAMMTAFQTTPAKWDLWAPTLERIAKSIAVVNPQLAGGATTVRLPTAADLANDSSPLMDAWEYRNKVGERTSHEFSDAIIGQESDLISPSTGKNYTLPLNAYDPTKGGYHNPNKWEEILVDPYAR